ncbi:hypothetical protein GGS23DRAFT_554320 [Durotheca rogersii]|uniref:uncharacterized protein n=1 Tax=Durotheca rogersii TaxID=419775 RepID=UPI00222002CE|nr:uncharacterized protein GGS23DRAFT_554320 [Durotheca rogersii]KAI5865848.1 hypothetical protein GGS23DRAFT_554320 [Durotheca rogersii]
MAAFQVGFYTTVILAALKVTLIAVEIMLHVPFLVKCYEFLISFPGRFKFILVYSLLKPLAFLFPSLNWVPPDPDGGPASLLRSFGYVSAFFALVLGGVSFVGLGAKESDEPGQCENADADIVGDGVRAAAWMQVGILFLITFTGIWHPRETAVKEIGGGLIITHVSLAIALLVPWARRELSPIDAILGAIILDAQGSSLSIHLVTKETLAARWQVGISLLAQLLGLAIEGILVGSFTSGLLPSQDCDCFSVFWWAWFSNCLDDSPPNDIRPYWIYFAYRFLNIAHGSYFAVIRAETYHQAERWDIENPCNPVDFRKCQTCYECSYCRICKRKAGCDLHGQLQTPLPIPGQDKDVCPTCKGCIKCGYDFGGRPTGTECCVACHLCKGCGHHISDRQTMMLYGERFSESFVTVSVNFLENSVLAMLSMISAEVTMAINQVHKTSPLYSVGQLTALTVAGGTVIRALWYFIFMFYKGTR